MPMYTYQCKECKEVFDDYQAMDDRKVPESKPCPSCGKENSVIQVIMGRVGIVYKDTNKTSSVYRDTIKTLNKEYYTNVGTH